MQPVKDKNRISKNNYGNNSILISYFLLFFSIHNTNYFVLFNVFINKLKVKFCFFYFIELFLLFFMPLKCAKLVCCCKNMESITALAPTSLVGREI